MTAMNRTKAFAQVSALTATRRISARRARQLAVHAVRQYWSCRHSGSRYAAAGSTYGYLREYPQRGLPRYDEHVGSPDRNYMAGVGSSHGDRQSRRRSSSWPSGRDSKDKRRPGDDQKYKKDGKHELSQEKDPWETRTRVAGEHYLRLMEEHMKILRKDPYWGLFGQSELRGVWNPWRKYHAIYEKSSRHSLGERQTESAYETYKPSEMELNNPIPRHQANERYRFDPITGRNVPCEPSEILPSESKPDKPKAGQIIDIPVKKYRPTSDLLTAESAVKSKSTSSKSPPLTGFAQQPWLVQEGFMPPSQKNDFPATKSPPSLQHAREESRTTQSKPADVTKTAQDASAPKTNILAPRLMTALTRAIEHEKTSDPREGLGKREDLDHLRPEDIRAATRQSIEPKKNAEASAEIRWEDIEAKVLGMFKDREARLEKEFAADRWELKRSLKAYPGEILRTMEEKRARRRLLERAFNSGMNKFEQDLAKVLGTGVTGSHMASGRSKEDMSIKSYESMSKVARQIQAMREQLNSRYYSEAAEKEAEKRRRAFDAILLKEIEQQKAAMIAHEVKPRVAEQEDKLAKTQALVKEIRSIYKETGGQANAKTSQISKAKAPTSSNSKAKKPDHVSPEVEAAENVLEASVREFEAIMAKPMPSLSVESLIPERKTTKAGEEESKVAGKEGMQTTRPGRPQLWLLLAYNEDTGKMRIIRTTSSKHVEKSARRTVDAILNRLSDPEPYLDYIEQMEKSGFELVAGNAKLLIYKDKLNRAIHQAQDSTESSKRGWGVLAEEEELVQPENGSKLAAIQDQLKEMATPKLDELRETPLSARTSGRSAEPHLGQRIRRLEENFSGPGPRFAEGEGAPEYSEERLREQQRRWRFGRVIRTTLVIVGVIYACGISLEWMRERDKERLIKEYQREVQRVKEAERQRALDERNSHRSYLSSLGLTND